MDGGQEAVKRDREPAKKMSLNAWREEGERLFGKDPMAWKFVCPVCGNIQSAADFQGLDGASPEDAYYNCLGRFLPTAESREAFPGKGGRRNPARPCNYTLGGLFHLPGAIVAGEDGKEYSVFGFANEEKSHG